jgi:hypothetical protein
MELACQARRSGAATSILLSVGNREARVDCQCGKLIDRIAAGAPVRKLLFVEALGDSPKRDQWVESVFLQRRVGLSCRRTPRCRI